MTNARGTLLLAWFALLGLCPPVDGQRHMLRRTTRPILEAELDLGTGVLTRGPLWKRRGQPAFDTAISLNNLDLGSGFVGIDSVGCEWYEHANKGFGRSGGKSTFMTSFLFVYCSTADDIRSGGVGGSAVITFREGYTGPTAGVGSDPSGTIVATYNLSGLPANTSRASWLGAYECYRFRVRTARPQPAWTTTPPRAYNGGVCLPDGQIGYGWRFADQGPLGTLAATFTFLACVQSCSGVGPDQSGVGDNFLDKYDCVGKPGGLLSTFTFGTTTTFTSFAMQVREAEAIESTSSTFNGTGANPMILTPAVGAIMKPAGPGERWRVFLDCSSNPNNGGAPPSPGLAILRLSFQGMQTPLSTPEGELLVKLTGAGRNFIASHSANVVQFRADAPASGTPIPLRLDLYNLCYVMQGWCEDPGETAFVSNGLAETVGSF